MKTEANFLQNIFLHAGFDMAEKPDMSHPVAYKLHYRNNPDGSIRWLWPAGSRDPNFLKFYNAGSARAKLFSQALRIIFRARCERLFAHGELELYAAPATIATLTHSWGKDFALFTGTPGPNRKGVIWYRRGGSGVFIKIAAEASATQIIHRENDVLRHLRQFRFYCLHYPSVVQTTANAISLSDVSVRSDGRAAHFTDVHARALQELDSMTGQNIRIDQASWWPLTIRHLRELAVTNDKRLPKGLIRKLQSLADSIPSSRSIHCVLAHGDFTPWNMYVSRGSINLYDWELSIPDAPAMWDAFHFIFQAGILVHRHPVATILREAAKLRQYELVEGEFDNYLRLYLLINCCYYLQLYSRQPRWHVQIGWLLQTWSEALDIVLEQDGISSQRQLLCMDVFDHLQNKPYAALKWLEDRPEDVPVGSDIDFCVDRKIVGGLDQFIRKHPLVARCRTRQKSFMKNYAVFLKDGSLLSIDAIWEFMRKDVRMLDAADLLESRRKDKYDVQTPATEIDCRYTLLFYLLNGASVPERYQARFWKSELAFAFEYNKNVHEAILKRIKSRPANMGWHRMLNKVLYFGDVAGDMFHSGGMVVTFSGVDGAGKSTIIENTRRLLEKQLRKKVVVLRHRPSLLPILSAWTHGKEVAEKKAAATLPRQGTNKSNLSSLLRFAYYYVDYLFGQFYVQFRYVNRGYVVLYDRYYFDFINDSRRSNIRLSPSFTRWFYRFLLKPDLNFFLYAMPEEILLRKQELDAVTIRELTDKYISLFSGLTRQYRYSKYIPIHNLHLAETVATIFEHIKISA